MLSVILSLLKERCCDRCRQSIATSPKCSWARVIPWFQGKLGWWNIVIWTDRCLSLSTFVLNPQNPRNPTGSRPRRVLAVRDLEVWESLWCFFRSKYMIQHIGKCWRCRNLVTFLRYIDIHGMWVYIYRHDIALLMIILVYLRCENLMDDLSGKSDHWSRIRQRVTV